MNLKLGIVLGKKPNANKIESIVSNILYPYLSSSPIKEIVLKEGYNKNDMKDIYKIYKMEHYQGVSFKTRKEDMVARGIDTLEGFCKEQYGIIRFTENGESVITHNGKAFIDEYKIAEVKRISELEEDYLSMGLKAIIDKDLKVHHRELQVYKRTPSFVIKPIVDSLKKTDYVILVDYIF